MTKPLPVWKRILFELARASDNGCTRRDLEHAVGVGTAVTERIRTDIRPRGHYVYVERRWNGRGKVRYYYVLNAATAMHTRQTDEYQQWFKSQRGVTGVS